MRYAICYVLYGVLDFNGQGILYRDQLLACWRGYKYKGTGAHISTNNFSSKLQLDAETMSFV